MQESLEAAEDASRAATGAKEALQARLTQAIAAEDGLRARCQLLEAQATSTASQLQEAQQQVYTHVSQQAPSAAISTQFAMLIHGSVASRLHEP